MDIPICLGSIWMQNLSFFTDLLTFRVFANDVRCVTFAHFAHLMIKLLCCKSLFSPLSTSPTCLSSLLCTFISHRIPFTIILCKWQLNGQAIRTWATPLPDLALPCILWQQSFYFNNLEWNLCACPAATVRQQSCKFWGKGEQLIRKLHAKLIYYVILQNQI